MVNHDSDIDVDTEPHEADESGHIKTPRKAFSKLAVELTDEDLKAEGVQKLLLAEISRLESAAINADTYREKFHKADKNCAVLSEKGKQFLFSEILYSISLTTGAVLLGLYPSVPQAISTHIMAVGIILIIGAVIAKTSVFRKRNESSN